MTTWRRVIGTLMLLRRLLNHPMNKGRALGAIRDVLTWQVASRLIQAPIAMPFVERTRLLVCRGMTGATGNIYSGLHEFDDMAFLLHFLRQDDSFLDIGANVGTYTILASGVCGAFSISVEPVPTTLVGLRDNVRLNDLDSKVEIVAAALGSTTGQVSMSSEADTMNHIAFEGFEGETVRVPLLTVDSLLTARTRPSLIKVDVEGFEREVMAGARDSLANERLKAIIVEDNDCVTRFGGSGAEVRAVLESNGFRGHTYDPWKRLLEPDSGGATNFGNRIYVRDLSFVERRVSGAEFRRIKGRLL